MKIWQIEIGTEEGGSRVEVLNGLAETVWEAIDKAIMLAKGHYKNPYPSKVTEIGDKVF